MADEPEAMEPEAAEPEAIEPEAAAPPAAAAAVGGVEKLPAKRAPIAKIAKGEQGPDILQQLQIQQLERIQLSVDFLTTPGVRPQPKEKKEKYLQDKLKLSTVEMEKAFKQAEDLLLAPAREFLLNEKVRGQPVAKKVEYLQKQLQLNDQDLEEAFKQIGDEAGPKFFAKKRIATGVKFLLNPALASKPGEAKVQYLQNKMKLTKDEVAEAFRQVVLIEQKNKAQEEAAATAAAAKTEKPSGSPPAEVAVDAAAAEAGAEVEAEPEPAAAEEEPAPADAP